MLSRVIAKNIGDVFFRDAVYKTMILRIAENVWSLSASVNDSIGKGLLMSVCRPKCAIMPLCLTGGKADGEGGKRSYTTTVSAVFQLRRFCTTPRSVAD